LQQCPEWGGQLGDRSNLFRTVRLMYTAVRKPASAISRPDDPVTLTHDRDCWEVCDAHGQTLSAFHVSACRPTGTYLRGEVFPVLLWRKEDGYEDYQHLLRLNWRHVILPELVVKTTPTGR
jgi:hypothetical protein